MEFDKDKKYCKCNDEQEKEESSCEVCCAKRDLKEDDTYYLKNRCLALYTGILSSLCMLPKPMFTRMVSLHCNVTGFSYRHLEAGGDQKCQKE